MRAVLAIFALLGLAPPPPPRRRRDPPHRARHPAHQGELLRRGYGYGYAFAQDNLCDMAETYVTVNGERSRYFGPDGSYQSRGNGATINNLDSDFFFQRIDDRVVEGLLAKPPPAGPLPEMREAARGYVAGYNRYLPRSARTGSPTRLPRQGVGPPDHRGRRLPALLPARAARSPGRRDRRHRAGAAADPGAGGPACRRCRRAGHLGELEDRLPLGDLGSNAVALGKKATKDGKGLLLGNPHFPWDGSERFYQAQLTIPGKIDVAGASLFGVPLMLIGHTRDLAWSHTVSTAFRFTPYELKLVPGSPDHVPRRRAAEADGAQEVTVQALKADGTLEPRTRTLYSTEYGPVFTSLLGLPLFPWTPGLGLRDGRRQRLQLPAAQPLPRGQPRAEHRAAGRDRAQLPGHPVGQHDRRRLERLGLLRRHRHGPARHRRAGRALQHDRARQATFDALGLPVLDGSRSACHWGSDPDAAAPGILGPGADAVAVPRRLRHELQRLLLALEPRAAAGGLRPDHRRRAHGALAAHPHRPADRGRPAREGAVHAPACSRTPCSPTARSPAS